MIGINALSRIATGKITGVVAITAVQAIGVRAVVAAHARGNGAVVAVLTTIRGLAVIDGISGIPVVAGMAGLTHVGRDRMACGFESGATNAVVASRLGAGLTRHRGMIKHRT